MFWIICRDQLQHRICANKTFVLHLVSFGSSLYEGFMKLLRHGAQVSVCCRQLFACLSGPVCLCAIISHHYSVQTELWAPPPTPTPARQAAQDQEKSCLAQCRCRVMSSTHTSPHTKRMCTHKAPWDMYSRTHSHACVCRCVCVCAS